MGDNMPNGVSQSAMLTPALMCTQAQYARYAPAATFKQTRSQQQSVNLQQALL
jgi:hypothetical protein